jgi:hypothetical protein
MKASSATTKTARAPLETPEVIIPASTALELREEAELPDIPRELDGFTGYEDIDPSRWIIPRVKIVQPTSKDVDATTGTLRVNVSGEEFEEIDIIVVKATQGRIWWEEGGGDKVLCRSYDFLHPDPAIESPPSEICARRVPVVGGKKALKPVCPKSMWGAGKERPACDETFNLLCIMTDGMLPFWVTLAGMQIKPVRNYLSAVAIRRLPLWQFETTLGLTLTTNTKGKFYVARFSSPKPISREFEQEILPVVMSIKDADIARTFAEEEAAAEGDLDTTGMPPTYEEGESLPEQPEWMRK